MTISYKSKNNKLNHKLKYLFNHKSPQNFEKCFVEVYFVKKHATKNVIGNNTPTYVIENNKSEKFESIEDSEENENYEKEDSAFDMLYWDNNGSYFEEDHPINVHCDNVTNLSFKCGTWYGNNGKPIHFNDEFFAIAFRNCEIYYRTSSSKWRLLKIIDEQYDYFFANDPKILLTIDNTGIFYNCAEDAPYEQLYNISNISVKDQNIYLKLIGFDNENSIWEVPYKSKIFIDVVDLKIDNEIFGSFGDRILEILQLRYNCKLTYELLLKTSIIKQTDGTVYKNSTFERIFYKPIEKKMIEFANRLKNYVNSESHVSFNYLNEEMKRIVCMTFITSVIALYSRSQESNNTAGYDKKHIKWCDDIKQLRNYSWFIIMNKTTNLNSENMNFNSIKKFLNCKPYDQKKKVSQDFYYINDLIEKFLNL
jgi:hypothetical protein